MIDWTGLPTRSAAKHRAVCRLGSFNICMKLLQIFYPSVIVSLLMYAVVCLRGQPQAKGHSMSGLTGEKGRLHC